jgi:hypothetical protein
MAGVLRNPVEADEFGAYPRVERAPCQPRRGVEKYRNSRLTNGVKMSEQNRKPQKPMRRFRPRMPANALSAKYRSAASKLIAVQACALRAASAVAFCSGPMLVAIFLPSSNCSW